MKGYTPLVLSIVLATAAVGCVDDDRGFVIVENRAPTTGCVGGAEPLWSGGLDVAVPRYGYIMFPVIENNMSSTRAADNQPERNTVRMRSFSVELSLPSGQESFSAPVAGTVKPGERVVLSRLQVMRPQDAAKLAGVLAPGATVDVEIRLRAVGDRSGDEMESAEFAYPVSVCNGCLVQNLGACPAAGTTVTLLPNVCGLPQDAPVSCCSADDKTDCLPGS